MPKLEHANLVLSAIEPTLKFLEEAFPEWRIRGEGKSDWHGKPRRWLHFGDGESYVTLNDHGEGAQRDLAGYQPGLAHLGFQVSSLNDVVERLERAGYRPHHLGEDHPHRKNTYFIDGEGLEFEFVEYLSNAPEEKNSYV